MKPLFLIPLFALLGLSAPAIEITVERLPAGAMQPQAMTDAAGDVHLVWLRGDPKACDVFYEKRPGGRTNGAVALRVNSQPGSAIAIGTIRGANLALGRKGRIHVVWNGSSAAEPKPSEGTPFLYSRMNNRGDAFEPQRNLSGRTTQLDGGGSVAADNAGNVFALWHASTGEKTRVKARGVSSSHDPPMTEPPSRRSGRSARRTASAAAAGSGHPPTWRATSWSSTGPRPPSPNAT